MRLNICSHNNVQAWENSQLAVFSLGLDVAASSMIAASLYQNLH